MTTKAKMKLSKSLFVMLLVNSIPSSFCQLALASPSYIRESYASRKVSTLSKGLNVRDTRSRALFTKYNDAEPSVFSLNSSAIESEIAAIFKEFAYGSSASSSTTTKSTTTTLFPAYEFEASNSQRDFLSGNTEPKSFIGRQREVFPDFNVSSDIGARNTSDLVSTTDRYNVIKSNTGITRAISYLVDQYNWKNSSFATSVRSNKANPVVNSFNTPDLDLNLTNRNPVSVTSISRKRGYEAIKQEIGKAWIFHVYTTGTLFAIVAAVCLLSLSRISACSQLLPRGYFITLHLMIFLASFLRCLLFLHDPYGAYGRLPSVLMSLLFHSVNPCLTTAYSVVFLVLLRASRVRLLPLAMQSPLVLATICGIHIGGSVVIDVSSGVLEDKEAISTINIVIQSITAAWGTLVCLGYVISFSGIEKAAQRQHGDIIALKFSRKSNTQSSKPSLVYAARLFLICTLLHGLLMAFIVLNLSTTKVPTSATSSEAWAWWTQSSLERIIEVALCVLLLTTALILTPSKPRNFPKEKDKIFSIFSTCSKSKGLKNIDVYPVAKENNIFGSKTLNPSSLTSSLSFDNGSWQHIMDPTLDCGTLNNQVLNTGSREFKKALQKNCDYIPSIFPHMQLDCNVSTLKPCNYFSEKHSGNRVEEIQSPGLTKQHDNCCSHYNMCNKVVPISTHQDCSEELCNFSKNEKEVFESSTALACHHGLCWYRHSSYIHRNSARAKYSKATNEYEIAPYHTTSRDSNVSYVYRKPCSYYPAASARSSDVADVFALKCKSHPECNLPKPVMDVCSSSSSEIQTDHSLEASSSSDSYGNTLSRTCTLPLTEEGIGDNRNCETNRNHDQDSVLDLDYSSPTNGDIPAAEYLGRRSRDNRNKKSRVLKLSGVASMNQSPSINKTQSDYDDTKRTSCVKTRTKETTSIRTSPRELYKVSSSSPESQHQCTNPENCSGTLEPVTTI